MKWVALKLKNLPLIALETDRVIEVFGSLSSRMQLEYKRDDAKEVAQLKNEIQERIRALDAFYETHCHEGNIAMFHLFSLKFQRAIFRLKLQGNSSDLGQLSIIAEKEEDVRNNSMQQQINLLEQPLFTYYESTHPTHKIDNPKLKYPKKPTANKSATTFGGSLSNKKTDPFAFDPTRVMINKTSYQQKSKSKIEQATTSTNTFKPIEKPIAIRPPMPSEKAKRKEEHTPTKGKSIQIPAAKKDFKIVKDPALKVKSQMKIEEQTSQLKFTIKMSRAQYEQLQAMKRQMQKQGKI